jgi:thioredoxin reductase
LSETPYDVAVVGGGPAGLSAALMLGRSRRRVVLYDDGRPRNGPSRAAHGYLTRDGEPPGEIRRVGREEVARYGVEVRDARVTEVGGRDGEFLVRSEGGDTVTARKLLLATGVVDRLPTVAGVEALYGTSVFHCPYCDAWEVRDAPLAAYGPGREGAELALALLGWSDDVVLFTGGSERPLRPAARRELERQGVRVRTEPVVALEGTDGVLERVVLAKGPPEPRRALFFHLGTEQRSDLPERLGIERNRRGAVRTDRFEGTNVPGVWVVGDASRDVQWIVVAAAEGARAAFAIHKALRADDLRARATHGT